MELDENKLAIILSKKTNIKKEVISDVISLISIYMIEQFLSKKSIYVENFGTFYVKYGKCGALVHPRPAISFTQSPVFKELKRRKPVPEK